MTSCVDLWSAGTIIFEVFTGRHPYDWYFESARTRSLPVDPVRGVLVEDFDRALLVECGAPPELVELIDVRHGIVCVCVLLA